MSTQEKLTSLDKNYECRNYERWQNLLYFTIISFSVLGGEHPKVCVNLQTDVR